MRVGGFNLRLGSPGLGGMPNGLNIVQLAQLNGMNPFNMNMLGMANLSAIGISPEAQLLAAQIAAAGGGFGQQGLAGLGDIGGFAGLYGGMVAVLGAAVRDGMEAAHRASALMLNNGGAKDKEDFDPVELNDVVMWLRLLRLHNYTPNFEGMSWKEMCRWTSRRFRRCGTWCSGGDA